MNNPFVMSEIGKTQSPLAELSKSFDTLPDRELNKSVELLRKKFDDLAEGILPNKQEGLRRESEVKQELEKEYPESKGYEIISEALLRDSNGKPVKDPETGEARRIDFVVVKDGTVVDSIEVTSETADKTGQTAKENRIRAAGGNYVRTSDGSLAEYPNDLQTTIERRK